MQADQYCLNSLSITSQFRAHIICRPGEYTFIFLPALPQTEKNEEKKGTVDINNEKNFHIQFFYSSHPGFWPRLGFNAFWFKGIGRK